MFKRKFSRDNIMCNRKYTQVVLELLYDLGNRISILRAFTLVQRDSLDVDTFNFS